MATVQRATELLEEIFFDEFKGSYLDREELPSLILDIHKFFKYQTRIYTFSSEERIKQLYDDLRAGRISENGLIDDGKLASYPLLFLTELSQKLMSRMVQDEIELTDGDDVILTLRKKMAIELGQHLTMHGSEQDIIKDDYYQSCLGSEKWVTAVMDNPWLFVAILIRFTGYILTENLYAYTVTGNELLEELNK